MDIFNVALLQLLPTGYQEENQNKGLQYYRKAKDMGADVAYRLDGSGARDAYGTESSNIASQRVAHRAGYYPAWICSYKGVFEGYDLLPTS